MLDLTRILVFVVQFWLHVSEERVRQKQERQRAREYQVRLFAALLSWLHPSGTASPVPRWPLCASPSEAGASARLRISGAVEHEPHETSREYQALVEHRWPFCVSEPARIRCGTVLRSSGCAARC